MFGGIMEEVPVSWNLFHAKQIRMGTPVLGILTLTLESSEGSE